jgi:general secretion pathway protein I
MRLNDHGFSVMEALVAMSVLAVAAGGFLRTAQETAQSAGQTQDRVVARWVAEDVLTRLQAGQRIPQAAFETWGRRFEAVSSVEPVADGTLQRVTVTVTVFPKGAAVSRTGYLKPEGILQ